MNSTTNPLAVVTGASSGIGLELARLCAQNGFDLVIAADEAAVEEAAEELALDGGVTVTAVLCDLATKAGVDALTAAVAGRGRPVEALLANAGRGLGHAFLDQDLAEALEVAHTNIDGTLRIIHTIGRDMRRRRQGRILITGSVAGLMPGAFQAVYNGSKAFIDSFAVALRNELKDSGVTVTCLMPGPTETHFFERAGLTDTKLAAEEKADPAAVAKAGFEAMMKGELKVITGFRNKLRAAMTHVLPDSKLAEQHRKTTAPGSARSAKGKSPTSKRERRDRTGP
jgi:uncharacterized protein